MAEADDSQPLRVAWLVADARDEWGQFDRPEPVFGPVIASLLQGFDGLPGCELHLVCCASKPMGAPARIASNIYYHQLPVPRLGRLRTLYLGCFMAVRRKLRELRPDVVHGQGTERYWGLAAAVSGFPSIITLHGNMRTLVKVNKARPFSFLWLTARMEALALPRADGILCISEYTRGMVGPLAKRTWLLPNAADSAGFLVNRSPLEPAEILCVGHVQARKNQVGLIRALRPLAERQRFVLRFFGGVEKGDPYGEEFMRELQSAPWCEYAGNVGRAGLNEAMGQAALLVLPSFEDNCPIVILEAMSAGLPVAGSNVGGIPELIRQGVNGLLFDPLDPGSITRSVAECLNEPARREERARVARAEATLRFAPRRVAQGHLDIYRDLLASLRRGR